MGEDIALKAHRLEVGIGDCAKERLDFRTKEGGVLVSEIGPEAFF